MPMLEFVALHGTERGPSDGRQTRAVAAVLRAVREDSDGCLLSAGPVALARILPGAVALLLPRCKPFTLGVRGGRACFSRSLRLPPPLRGLGLGTWLMAGLVRQAVARGLGAARVRSLHLVARDASDLRDNFYRAMGFAVTVWRDGSGWARAARLDALRTRPNAAKARPLAKAEAPPDLLSALAAGARRL